jgi:hypothetical protein
MAFKSIPNPTLGDVPDDVFRYVMFPYMDYDSRINFNQVMPPDWRVSRKFKEYSTLSHNIYTLVNVINDSMDKVLEKDDVDGRALAMTKMFNLCARPHVLAFINTNEKLKKVVLERTKAHYDVANLIMANASEGIANMLSESSHVLHTKLLSTTLVPMQLNFKLEPISVV